MFEIFSFLSELSISNYFELKQESNYAEEIVRANMPYKPGVYLVYSLDNHSENKKLLYYGKAGVTANGKNPKLNYHQLPQRLLATVQLSENHEFFTGKKPKNYSSSKKDARRSKLWPWYVKNHFKNGIRIYWFITDFFKGEDPNDYECKIKNEIKISLLNWRKSI